MRAGDGYCRSVSRNHASRLEGRVPTLQGEGLADLQPPLRNGISEKEAGMRLVWCAAAGAASAVLYHADRIIGAMPEWLVEVIAPRVYP